MTGRSRGPAIQAMFDGLADCYDRMNGVMTLGWHHRWRRAAAAIAQPQGLSVLDVATGTGDLALALLQAGARRVVGVDFSRPMLEAARQKLPYPRNERGVSLAAADALALPFGDGAFDRVTSAFLLRNLVDLGGGLQEMRRVLKPGGRLVALEIAHPPGGAKAIGPSVYFHHVVPFLGGIVTGQWRAYRYLASSLAPFPDAERLCSLFHTAGFQSVSYKRLGLGMVTVHVGEAPTS